MQAHLTNCWLSLCFFLLLVPLAAQESPSFIVNYRDIDQKDGLSHRSVKAILQDQTGYIWMGTTYGLDRYDGRQFKHYSKGANGLSGESVRQIMEDGKGRLWIISNHLNQWIGNDQFVDILDPFTDDLQSIDALYSAIPFDTDQIINGFSASDGNIYFDFDYGNHLYQCRTDGALRPLNIENTTTFELHAISPKMFFWGVADNNRLVKVDSLGRILKEFPLAGPSDLANTAPLVYGTLKGEEFWYLDLSDPRELAFFQVLEDGYLIKKEWEHYFPENWDKSGSGQVSCHYLPVQNLFFFRSYSKAVLAHPEFGYMMDISSHLELKALGFIGRRLFPDRSGKVWVCSDFGVRILSIQPKRFDRSQTVSRRGGLRELLEYKGDIYVAEEYRGIYRLSEDLQNWELLIPARTWQLNYSALAADVDGGLWVGGTKLIRFQPETRQITMVTERLPSGILCIQPIDRDRLLVGFNRGITWVDKQTGNLYPVKYNGFPSLREAIVIDIEPDGQNAYWVCTNLGLYHFDPLRGVTARYSTEGKDQYYLPFDRIQHLYQEQDDRFWLATGGGGLIRWDPTTGESHQITRKDGMPNNMVYAVYGDQSGSLWMSTDYGIVRYEPESGRIQTFLPEDGTSNQEYNRLSHFQNEKGELFFGGLQRGMTRVVPGKFLNEEQVESPNLVVTFFHQLDGKADTIIDRTTELLVSNAIELQLENRGFRLGVALLAFDNQEKVQYAWKIGEESEDWHYQYDPVIQLSELQYGEHQLIIRAQDPCGQWSPNELTISLIVPSPVFRRAWFWCLVVLILLGCIYAGYRYRIFRYRRQQLLLQEKIEEATQQILLDKSTIEKQAQQLKHLDELKSNFFANLSHEFRTPLTLILGPVRSLIGREYLRDRDRALLATVDENGNKLLKMVNELLDLTKLEAKKIDVQEKPVLLYPFLLKLISGFEVHAEGADVALKFDYQLDKELCLLFDREKLDRVLSNFLSNAIKFTPRGGYVSFRVMKESGEFRFEVMDSGIGIHQEDQPFVFNRYFRSRHFRKSKVDGTGIGLALSKELSELMKGEVGLGSMPDEGSVFWCKFPFKTLDKAALLKTESLSSIDLGEMDKGASSTTDQEYQGRENQYTANILIAEDHSSLREFLVFLLQRKYNLTLTSNGYEALEKLSPQLKSPELIAEEERIHLVITDIMMPRMDGLSLLERIKSDPNGKLLPVIILTARADMKDKLRALHTGVDDYLLKPFVEEELLARISNLLDQSHLRRLPMSQEEGGASAALESPLGEVDLEFLKKLELLVEKEIKDPSLSTSWLAGQFSLSERQLQRRLKQVTGLSPNHYVRAVRLQKAREFLERGRFGTVAEISYAVGFSTPSYFSRIYKRQFGKSPSDYF